MGEVLAFTAPPGRVRVEVPGRNGPSHALDEMRGPGQILDGPGGLPALDLWDLGFHELVQAETRDPVSEGEVRECVRGELQVLQDAPFIDAAVRGLHG